MSLIAVKQFDVRTDQTAYYRALHARMNRPRLVVAAPPPAPEPEPAPVPVKVIDIWKLGGSEADVQQYEKVEASPAFKPKAAADAIVAEVAAHHGVTVEEIVGPRRHKHIVRARQAAVAAIYTAFPNWSLPRIGEFFGGRDHTTILYSVKQMGAWRK